MSTTVTPPFPLFADEIGAPLDRGFLYIGEPHADPVQSPKTVYWDAAFTEEAVQPVRTRSGYPVKDGAPSHLFVSGDFSLAVKDRNNITVFESATNAPNGGGITLGNGETLALEQGAAFVAKDGATIAIGDNSGTAVVVTMAANARISGHFSPQATGQDLGNAGQRWDLFGQNINVSTSIQPAVAGVPSIGGDSAPFNTLAVRAVRAKSISVFRTQQPTEPEDLARSTAHDRLLCGVSMTSADATVTTENAYNVASVTHDSTGKWTVTFTVPLGSSGTTRRAMATIADTDVTGFGAKISVKCTLTTCEVRTADMNDNPEDMEWNLEIRGSPDVADPIG